MVKVSEAHILICMIWDRTSSTYWSYAVTTRWYLSHGYADVEVNKCFYRIKCSEKDKRYLIYTSMIPRGLI